MKSKHRNIKTDVNGVKFDSKGEAKRFVELSIMEKAGAISDLKTQVQYRLIPSKRKSDGSMERGITYKADFVYRENGKTVVEDFKGQRTQVYVLKRKLMLHVHGIEIREITKKRS